ncbi:hypothetical protein BT63DRAFT_430591 [Microthyrium microscopicum]|uniref:N-acetyltransferase domain-containing protein n=1 Tax=Microthyrium microscopicum TaxID=703497 RepID=A0A6A6TVF6_9PEZI|nr:hypothetical protein BT63DRAFT_430591 [Microthyrium microscopicum]
MPQYAVQPCTIDDGADIARVHVSAFWTEPAWKIIWPNKTREYVTNECKKRMPFNIITDPIYRRQQKAVDTGTGRIVGYARWTLPELDGVEVGSLWPGAKAAEVSGERKQAAAEASASADWAYDGQVTSELDKAVDQMKKELLSKKQYIVLDILGVHPDVWRQGVANLLLNSGLKAIREFEVKLDVFVVAKSAGVGVYDKAGLKKVGEVIQDGSSVGIDTDYAAWFYVWEAEN